VKDASGRIHLKFPETDKVNVRLPRSLAGRGAMPVDVPVDGKLAKASQTYFVEFR
jgi:hypothetical protein